MKRPNNSGKRVVPQVGGEVFHEGEPAPLTYSAPMPPVKSRGRLVPIEDSPLVDCGEPLTGDVADASRAGTRGPQPDVPLVPASEEVAQLPRAAREAFAARCAARVARLRAGATTPEAAAALILAAATVSTPVRKLLLCLRRDFDRLASLAKRHRWTDDTPIPPDVFGPMWPNTIVPEWAKEPPPESNANPLPPTASN
jgi:hypothetical protein